jgi:hypothetical protein
MEQGLDPRVPVNHSRSLAASPVENDISQEECRIKNILTS